VPIYEFVCESCGRLSEVMQKLSDPAPSCPECGQGRMARTVSRTSFQLKGGGWYADLYASKKEKPAAGAKPGTGEAGAAPAGEKASPEKAAPEKAAAAAPASAPAASAGDAKK
jgi:putative FmdB family regulatory protein